MTHRFEPVMLVLALLVIPVVVVEESNAPRAAKLVAAGCNWLIWVGFTVEFVFVLAVASRKRAALRAHWLELLIVVLTPPFLPHLLSSLRAARLLRLLRLVRLGALGARAIRVERTISSRRGFRYIALATALIVLMAPRPRARFSLRVGRAIVFLRRDRKGRTFARARRVGPLRSRARWHGRCGVA